MATPIKAGLLGCGSVAIRGIIPHLVLDDAKAKIDLVAVADVDVERAHGTASRFGIPNARASLDEMLGQDDVDVVIITTPIPFHFENTLQALEGRKHVYVQKTMTTTLDEARKIIAARDRAGVQLSAPPGYQLSKCAAAIRRVVESEELGRINAAFSYTFGFGHEHEPLRTGDDPLGRINPAWYYQPGAGPLPDVTIYALHFLTTVLGPIVSVTALGNRTKDEREWQGQTFKVETNDNIVLTMEFASGTIGVAVGSNSRGSKSNPWGSITLHSGSGSLEVTEVHDLSGYPIAFTINGANPRTERYPIDTHPYLETVHHPLEEPQAFAELMDLADAIAEGRDVRVPAEQAAHVVELIERVHAAIAEGTTQRLESSF